jgi:hypothetical protein
MMVSWAFNFRATHCLHENRHGEHFTRWTGRHGSGCGPGFGGVLCVSLAVRSGRTIS